MKKCPYCAGQIQDSAIKCRYCGEFLNKQQEVPWYFKTYCLIIAFLCVGPLALPLLWINPRFSRRKKIVITVIVIILTYYLIVFMRESLKTIGSYYNLMFSNFETKPIAY